MNKQQVNRTISICIHTVVVIHEFCGLSLHLKKGACCLGWNQLWLPDRRGCGAGSVGTWWKNTQKRQQLKNPEHNLPQSADISYTLLHYTHSYSLHILIKFIIRLVRVVLTYCTHSTARPFCMYSVMHLTNWSFSSRSWEKSKTHEPSRHPYIL